MRRNVQVSQKIHARLAADLPINSRVSVAIVQDPYSDCGEQIQVLRSTRDDPLSGLHARKFIDAAQLAAGRRWQELYEKAEVGAIRAIDPTKEAVDGGRIPEPITDHQIRALRQLDEAHAWLGKIDYMIVFTVLGERMMLKDAAERHGYVTAREQDYFGRRFKDCLEQLAVHFGFAGKKHGR